MPKELKFPILDLVVQCANFEIPPRNSYQGKRIFADSEHPKIVNIAHHLAHAYSAAGTTPFLNCMIMVIDGCGSPLNQWLEIHPERKQLIDPKFLKESNLYLEKDSFYFFDGQKVKPLIKDFSELAIANLDEFTLPVTQHSIGGFYAAISHYVFGNLDDVGKLMGLAPFGKSGELDIAAFTFKGDRLLVTEDWKQVLNKPCPNYETFKKDFQYYAAIAKWAQEQIELVVIKCIEKRMTKYPHANLCYTGGVALNAVANAKLEDRKIADNIYFEPAAADNGLALGCAYYGWLEYLNKPRVLHDGSTCFGRDYSIDEVKKAIEILEKESFNIKYIQEENTLVKQTAALLNKGKTVAWFQSGSEFGPRSLGRRSILAHPGIENLKDHINLNIKFREDFRPFAPAVLKSKVHEYFEKGRDSPYMILVDKTRQQYRQQLKNVTHCDGSARVQTVEQLWNPRFHNLLEMFYRESGIAVLLNTSLNRKGMPIVETPEEAIDLFQTTALDILVIENFFIEKIR